MKPPKSSLRKLAANRVNARASTGPKTAAGKKRAAQNARRHGLSIPVSADPTLSAEVKTLAREILSSSRVGSASDQQRALAAQIAEAQIALARARRARHHMLAQALNDPDYISHRLLKGGFTALLRILDLIEQNMVIPDHLEQAVSMQPEERDKLASILMDHVRTLSTIDRYERRALSRRKFAIRDFDTLCRRPA